MVWIRRTVCVCCRVVVLIAGPDCFAAHTPQPDSSALQAVTAPGTCVAKIDFLGKPKVTRVWSQTEFGAPNYVSVSAQLKAVDTADRPCPSVPLTLLALAVSKAEGRGTTDVHGQADLQADFGLPVGSLQVRVEVCHSENPSICAPPAYVVLRNWVDLTLGFDTGATFAPLPSGGSESVIDVTAIGVGMPRFQINVWEAVREFRPYRFSVYGQVPFVAIGRGLSFTGGISPRFERLDQRAGFGDFSAGGNLFLGGIAHVDVAYNGRTGKINLVDAVRNLSSPRVVNLGDGFESIDTRVQLRIRLGGSPAFVSAYGTDSHAFRRALAGGQTAERGDFTQLLGGIGIDIGRRGAGVLFWGGRSRYGEVRIPQSGVTDVPFRGRDDWLVGLAANTPARPHTNVGVGFIAGGLGSPQIYVAANLSLNFTLF